MAIVIDTTITVPVAYAAPLTHYGIFTTSISCTQSVSVFVACYAVRVTPAVV